MTCVCEVVHFRQHTITLQVAMSCWKYASAVMTVASTTLCGVAPGASAVADAMASSFLQASARFTAVGRLHRAQS